MKDLCFPEIDFKVFKLASSRKRRSVVGESARKTRSSAKEVDADGDESAEEVGVESGEEGEGVVPPCSPSDQGIRVLGFTPREGTRPR